MYAYKKEFANPSAPTKHQIIKGVSNLGIPQNGNAFYKTHKVCHSEVTSRQIINEETTETANTPAIRKNIPIVYSPPKKTENQISFVLIISQTV